MSPELFRGDQDHARVNQIRIGANDLGVEVVPLAPSSINLRISRGVGELSSRNLPQRITGPDAHGCGFFGLRGGGGLGRRGEARLQSEVSAGTVASAAHERLISKG